MRSRCASSRNGSRSRGIAWIFASSSAICTGSSGGSSMRTRRRPIVSPSSRSMTNASRPSRSSMYMTGRGTFTPASKAAVKTSNSWLRESVCLWMTPTAARRTSRRSPPASTDHASFDAPPARRTGSETGPRTACNASRIRAIIAVMVERRERVRAFMEEHVYPNESALFREDDAADALVRELQGKAKAAGLWAPHLPPEAGGSGGGFLEYAYLNEEIGRSFIAQLDLRLPGAGRRQRRDPPPVRHRRAEGALPAAARRGRDALVLRHDRAGGGRLRPDAAARARGARRRRVGDRRAQVVLVGRRRRRLRRSSWSSPIPTRSRTSGRR